MVIQLVKDGRYDYIETGSLISIRKNVKDILILSEEKKLHMYPMDYEDDFRKIDPTGKLSSLFDAIPAQLMGNASRYQVSSVISGSRAGDVLEQIAELKDSGTVLVSYHANDPGPGMAQNKDLARFKLFTADTGLFVTLAFKDRSFTKNDVYFRLLSDKLQTNLGYLYENIVAQILATNGRELYYHAFLNERSRHNYKVDFLIAENNKISAIEVKSSGYKSHPSIDAFSKKFSSRISREILIYTKDYQKEGRLEHLPIVMAQFI